MFITSFQGFHLIKTCEIMILLLIDTLLVLPATVVMVLFITWYRSLYLSYFNEKKIIYKEMYISFFQAVLKQEVFIRCPDEK